MTGELAKATTDPIATGPTYPITLNGEPVLSTALEAEARTVHSVAVSEVQFVGFVVERREPDVEYRVRIGNATPGETEVFDSAAVVARGHARGKMVFWDDK